MTRDDAVEFGEWTGRRESRVDVAGAWPAAALAATFDRDDPAPRAGDALPPGWHWLYFLDTTPASDLGPDGHPKRGGFLPPVALPRRMWAGGRLDFRRAIRIGEPMRRDSEIVSVQAKQGKSGALVFVTVRHTVFAAGEIAVVEEHDIVYREAARPGEAQPAGKPAPADAAWHRELTPDAVLLFRFSALIFNAHRIHFDLEFCREEGYPGLIVHGPLQTLLLLDLCRRHEARPVTRLEYRALRPLIHGERMTVNGILDANGSTASLWTADAAGHCAMTGTATF